MFRKITGFLLVILITGSCKKEGTTFSLGKYPLKDGNEWEYITEVSTKEKISDPTLKYSFIKRYMKVVSDSKINGEICKKVFIWDKNIGNQYIDTPYVYYGNRKDGLYVIGGSEYRGSIAHFFSKEKQMSSNAINHQYSFMPFINPSLLSGKEFISSNPIQLTKLPVVTQSSWFSNEFGDNYAKRKWIGYEDVTVPAGTFKCAKLELAFDVPKGVVGDFPTVYQYLSEKGLIKEEYVFFIKENHASDEIAINVLTQLVKVNF